MEKEKKEQFEKIKQEKIRMEENLECFLNTVSNRAEYPTYKDLLRFLQAVDMKEMEMEELSDYIPICPYLKLDSERNVSVGTAIIYTYINCEIYDERKPYEGIPDELIDEITEFSNILEVFLFS